MTKKMLNNILICGSGQMGSWIAKKIASSGFRVIVYDSNPQMMSSLQNIPAITCETKLENITEKPDLIIETIVEAPQQKNELFLTLEKNFGGNTIFTSNSSILMPEQFLSGFKSKNKFSFFHFYFPNTAVDIMPLPETDPDIVETLKEFSGKIGEKPIVLKKINPGYLLSAMMGAATDVALDLIAQDIADPIAINDCWKTITGSKMGIVEAIDMIGLDTSLKIRSERLKKNQNDERLKRGVDLLQTYVSQGFLGRKTKKGFLEY